jgi:aminoglycoside phosphotransferase
VSHIPTAEDVRAAVRELIGKQVAQIERFPTGLTHFVFDIECSDGTSLVARLTRPETKAQFVSALHWAADLAPVTLPIAEIIALDLDREWPTMILERLPGTDLQHVYTDLSASERATLASDVSSIQRAVSLGLPAGTGYGYAHSRHDSALRESWSDVVLAEVARSQERIGKAGFFDQTLAESVHRAVRSDQTRLDEIPPTPFLDDTTTKNVIVHDGTLSGIVDIDHVCFGDPIFAIALTEVSIRSRGWDADYVDAWWSSAGWTESDRSRRELYVRVFALGFLSEIGTSFNSSEPEILDPIMVERLMNLIRS